MGSLHATCRGPPELLGSFGPFAVGLSGVFCLVVCVVGGWLVSVLASVSWCWVFGIMLVFPFGVGWCAPVLVSPFCCVLVRWCWLMWFGIGPPRLVLGGVVWRRAVPFLAVYFVWVLFSVCQC